VGAGLCGDGEGASARFVGSLVGGEDGMGMGAVECGGSTVVGRAVGDTEGAHVGAWVGEKIGAGIGSDDGEAVRNDVGAHVPAALVLDGKGGGTSGELGPGDGGGSSVVGGGVDQAGPPVQVA